jgi:hypothetical protein
MFLLIIFHPLSLSNQGIYCYQSPFNLNLIADHLSF